MANGKSITEGEVAIPSSHLLRDIVPIKPGVTSLKGSLAVRGLFIRRVLLFVQLSLSALTTAGTGNLSQLLSQYTYANGKGNNFVSLDGQASLIASLMGQSGKKTQAIDPTPTIASSYLGVYIAEVNYPSFGEVTYNLSTKSLSSITGLVATGLVSLGLMVESTNDLVGKLWKVMGQSFTDQTNQEFYTSAMEKSRSVVFESWLGSQNVDPADFNDFSAGGDGVISPTELFLLESEYLMDNGLAPAQGPNAGNPITIANGNTTKYYIMNYRSAKPGSWGFNSSTAATGAFVSKVEVLAGEL